MKYPIDEDSSGSIELYGRRRRRKYKQDHRIRTSCESRRRRPRRFCRAGDQRCSFVRFAAEKSFFGTVRRCVDADCRRMRYGGCDRGASDSHQGGDDQCRSVDSTRKSRPLRGKTEYHRAPRIGISDPFERLRIRYDTGLPLCAGRRRRSFSYPGFRQVGRNRHQHPCPPLPQGRLESSVRRNPEYRLRQGKECGDGQSGRRCYGAGLRRDVGRDGQPGQAGAVAEKFRRGLSGVRYRKSRLQRRVRPCVGERPYPLHLRGGLLRSAGFLR